MSGESIARYGVTPVAEGSERRRQRVGLFVTCLVDLTRPVVGFAAARLIEWAGYEVVVPKAQTCCGQPAYNSGDSLDAKAIARQVIEAFDKLDYLVAPSGSCAGMIKVHYPEMFSGDPIWADRAKALADKTYELTVFLNDVAQIKDIDGTWSTTTTYHDSCSGLRELSIKAQPRNLLSEVNGLTLTEADDVEACCGFGGLFSVKYSDISENMVDAKAAAIENTGADLLLGGDLGCLINISGRLKRRGSAIAVRHVAEVLAGFDDTPPIGEPE